jgi:Calcineurin-like phosphoesterase
MIQQVLNKQLLQDVLDSMQAQAQAFTADQRRADTGTPMDDLSPAEHAELLDSIEIAKARVHEGKPPAADRRGEPAVVPLEDLNACIPRSPELSNLQSAIESYFLDQRPDLIESPDSDDDRRGGTVPMAGSQLTTWQDYLGDRRVFGAFQQTDIGWINSLFAQGVRKLRRKHPFVDRPVRNQPISFADDNVRIIVVGDWGSGIPRAQNVAKHMRRELDQPDVKGWQKFVIHLGDVYYSGWAYEYKKRFLQYWPVREAEKNDVGSFNLNGNHDMYSGGWAYYDDALADLRFAAWQGKSSLFHLANSHWQLFGLDTSYDDGGLQGDQARWVCAAAQPGLKTMLLSHHQYCSSYETAPQAVIDKIDPVLNQLDVAAWLWGHEHRFMTYRNVPRIRFPRCIGHGGVPVYQTHAADAPTPSPGDWEYRDYVPGVLGIEHWAMFGFAVLDFHKDRIAVRYLDENGAEHRREILV